MERSDTSVQDRDGRSITGREVLGPSWLEEAATPRRDSANREPDDQHSYPGIEDTGTILTPSPDAITTGRRACYSLLERAAPYVFGAVLMLGAPGQLSSVEGRLAKAGARSASTVAPRTSPLLERVYAHCEARDPDSALDLVFEHIDDLLDAERFAEIDALLHAADVSRMDIPTMLGFLSTTVAASDELSARAGYVEQVRAHVVERGRSDDVEALLHGLV